MARKAKEVQENKEYRYYDYSLLFLTLFLVCFGLVMIYSTSFYNSQKLFGNPTHFLKKQGQFALLGFIVMIIVSKVDYRLYIKPLPKVKVRPITVLYFLAMALQIYVAKYGETIKGAKRWIEIKGLGSFQPSELTKIALILVTAYIVYLAPRRLDKFTGFIRVAVFGLPLIALVIMENLSTGIILAVILIAICFVASRKKLYYIVTGAIMSGVVGLFITSVGFRGSRVQAWLNVETHEKGYQTLQGLYAIATGGIFGKGLGQSMQKLGFIPESHNDMIFTVVCEELGLFGAIALIIIFILLLWRIFVIAISTPDLFGSLICVGVFVHIALQVIMNIAVVTNTIPSTGIPLPFISYGGSSVVVLLIEIGMVLSVSNEIKVAA